MKKKCKWDNGSFYAATIIAFVLSLAAVFGFGYYTVYPVFILVILGIVAGWTYSNSDVMPFLLLVLAYVLLHEFSPVVNSGLFVGAIVGTFIGLFKVFLSTAAFFVILKKFKTMF